MHCENYACNLPTCACICSNCESAKSYVSAPEPCKTCGTCPTCGRGGYYVAPPVYTPYYGQWWCYSCQMYHMFGYTCWKFNTTPFIGYTLISTYPLISNDINNTNIPFNNITMANSTCTTDDNIDTSLLTWTVGIPSEDRNNNS